MIDLKLMALLILITLGPLLGFRLYRWALKKIKIRRWMKTFKLQQHFSVFNQLFTGDEGFWLSRKARDVHQDAFDYTYGEIEFFSFIALILLANPNQQTRYYDLGSGIGKAAVACALVFEMQKYCGVELFAELYQAAQAKKQALSAMPTYAKEAQRLEFVNEDFLNVDFSDATLIFINATAFVGELWVRLSEKLEREAVGATIITTSKKLHSDAYYVKKMTQVNMSWGVVTAYIQEHWCQTSL